MDELHPKKQDEPLLS